MTLIKPQFECKKEEADLGRGIIRDQKIHHRVLDEIKDFVETNLEFISSYRNKSPPAGYDGNQEFFLAWERLLI